MIPSSDFLLILQCPLLCSYCSAIRLDATDCRYQSYNSTHIAPDFPITPLFPHARNRYFFVSDTGHLTKSVLSVDSQPCRKSPHLVPRCHKPFSLAIRGVFRGARSGGGHIAHIACALPANAFSGLAWQARSDRTGFNLPTGLAVMAPTGFLPPRSHCKCECQITASLAAQMRVSSDQRSQQCLCSSQPTHLWGETYKSWRSGTPGCRPWQQQNC